MTSRHTLTNHLVRLISAVALLTVAFSHVPAASKTADGVDLPAYAFPDGSVPVLCLSDRGDRDAPIAATNPCEFCRLSGAVLLPRPICGADLLFRLSQPAEQTPCVDAPATPSVHVASKPLRGPPQL